MIGAKSATTPKLFLIPLKSRSGGTARKARWVKKPVSFIKRASHMDKRLNYIHGALLDYGMWVRSGRTCIGVYQTSTWPSGKPVNNPVVKSRRKANSKYSVPTQPKETRITISKLPCLNIDKLSERIHPVIIQLPDPLKLVVCCLYIKGLCFRDTGQALNMTSRQIGKSKHKVLKA